MTVEHKSKNPPPIGPPEPKRTSQQQAKENTLRNRVWKKGHRPINTSRNNK